MKIAICGKMCSGKSTLANYIMSSYPGYQKYSFAQKVKELCSELFDMKGKDRPLLINFANKMREIDGKVWINQVLKQTEGKEKCIIDDVRYQNEVDALIEDDWSFIQLNVPILTQRERIMELYPDNYQEHIQSMNHISERNEFVFPEGYPQLVLDTSESNYHKNIQEVILFMNQ
jgi:deoxyadenosine/deoxycytidine kinase